MDVSQLTTSFLKLVTIMDELREQCPWDRKQTIETLRPLTIEETYELADAITDSNWLHIREELGDLFLHLLFYARIAKEQNAFTLTDVLEGISKKLIHRHPHIYSDVKVQDEEEVKRNWEKLKMQEGKKSILSGVPRSLPSMIKAIRIQEKVKQVGFEWDHKEQVLEKIQEELLELQEAVATNDATKMEEELGDVLFSVINYARFLQVDADLALERTNDKFMQRFSLLEEEALRDGKQLSEMTLEEMDVIWNAIKKRNRESDKTA